MMIFRCLIGLAAAALIISCQDSAMKGDNTKNQQPQPSQQQNPPPSATDSKKIVKTGTEAFDNPIVVGPTAETRGLPDLLCQEGPNITAFAAHSDFASQWSTICDGKSTTEFFKTLMDSAFVGDGDPIIHNLETVYNDDNSMVLTFAYAVTIDFASPINFGALKPHDIFALGIREGNSELQVNVDSRTPFPGKGSSEAIALTYDLTNANGAGINDSRKTEVVNIV